MAICLLASCGKDEAKEPEFLPPDPNATTIPPDPWAIPEQIDVAYAQRVTQKLLDIEGEVRADVITNNRFTDISKKKVAATYAPPIYEAKMSSLNNSSMQEHPEFKSVLPPAKALVTNIVATKECIYATGMLTDDVKISGPQEIPYSWGIAYFPSESTSTNPTGWKFIQDLPSSAAEGDPCVNR